MERFELLDAVAVPLDESNVDTDQICPARLIRAFAQPGRHEHVFLHDRRFNEDGSPKPEFILDQPAYANAQIIVAQRNFGVGSSREAAVMAVRAAGFRAIVAESFGDIFVNNCFKNGVLPIRLVANEVDALRASLHRQTGAHVAIDLAQQTVTGPDGGSYAFAIGALRKRCLLAGLDDLSLTERYADAIESFERTYRAELPWLKL
ncbi:MAG: 3-isopropylmalate dehydratase small subunit [Betaproteobacteria bacterium]|nr:3-isopropylmalate dehydratase small subunit [Betaproteobacteria bacterium]